MRICRLEAGNEKDLVKAIRNGALFVYPTDTIYGIGCNALKKTSVKKIRKLKNSRKPFSIIAPTKIWVQKNTKVKHKRFLKKLPGRYTLIFQKRRRSLLKEAAPGTSLGIRIPKNKFTRLVRKAGVPFITTSVNHSGKSHITKVSQIPKPFLKHIDMVIDTGQLKNRPSQVIDLSGAKPKKIR